MDDLAGSVRSLAVSRPAITDFAILRGFVVRKTA
jgi:hypothetical protein